MKMIKQPPIIIANRFGYYQQLEGDCACPIPVQKAFSAPGYRDDSAWKIAPSLYQSHLADGYGLAFNYMGNESVVVLNQSALEILHLFKQPRSFETVLSQSGLETHHPKTLPVVQELITLGLLVNARKTPKEIRTSDTLTVWLHVTNHCNLACDYCYLDKNLERMDFEIGQKAIDSVFRSALSNGFKRIKIKYSGGEATLNLPLVLQLHQYATELAAKSNLLLDGVVMTNGVALSLSMVERLKESQLRISISIDGVGDTNDIQRKFKNGRGSFSYVERTLNLLDGAGFTPTITITVTSRNAGGLAKTVEYLLGRNLPFSINFYRENECSASFTDLKYQEADLIKNIKEAFHIIEQNLPSYSLLGALADRARLDALHDRPCGVGDSYFVVNQNGGIAKCHMEIEKTITDIYAEDPLSLIRADQLGIMNHPVDEKEGCRDCEWRYWCSGGCPALTYRATGRYDIKSPNCNIYKALFPDVLRLEGLRLLKFGTPSKLL
jgi:uncharacterized protein